MGHRGLLLSFVSRILCVCVCVCVCVSVCKLHETGHQTDKPREGGGKLETVLPIVPYHNLCISRVEARYRRIDRCVAKFEQLFINSE